MKRKRKKRLTRKRGQYEAVDCCYSFSLCVFMPKNKKGNKTKKEFTRFVLNKEGKVD